jgi:LysM repeat protein
MDTISRENNSMLPVGAIIVGVIALLIGGYAAITVSKLNKTVTEYDAKFTKMETAVDSASNTASAAAERTSKDLAKLRSETQAGFDQVGPMLGDLRVAVGKLEDSLKKPAAPVKDGKDGKKGPAEPVVAGPGEYVVKPGDNGSKIAAANGVSLGDLQAVNAGVNWNGLKPGQKLKLPKK